MSVKLTEFFLAIKYDTISCENARVNTMSYIVTFEFTSYRYLTRMPLTVRQKTQKDMMMMPLRRSHQEDRGGGGKSCRGIIDSLVIEVPPTPPPAASWIKERLSAKKRRDWLPPGAREGVL
jgi:hypothetical protein